MDAQCNIADPIESKAYVDRALLRLRESGLRITEPRKQVVYVLAATRRPLGAYGIRERVIESGGKIDVVSVYRILTTLAEMGLAHHVGLMEGYIACTTGHAHEHETQHLICSACGCVEEIEIPSAAIDAIDAAGGGGGFNRTRAHIEVLGVCSHCKRSDP